MKCPKCNKRVIAVSHARERIGGSYRITYDIYEHASRVEGGLRVVSSRDCCYVEVTDALENNNQRNETDDQEQPANRAGIVGSSGSMPDEGQQESAAPATEPSEVTTQGE